MSTCHSEGLEVDTFLICAIAEAKDELSFPQEGKEGRLFAPVDFKT